MRGLWITQGHNIVFRSIRSRQTFGMMRQQQQRGGLSTLTDLARTPAPAFPVHGLLPKFETEAAAFMKKYPQYNGQNVKVAILDTGVDPAAAGLQVCPDGSRKLIDCIDCTGAGDVATTQQVDLASAKTKEIKLLSGRTITAPAAWKNPTQVWRLGYKRGFELFPKTLVNRLKSERRRIFEQQHHAHVTKAQKEVAEFDQKNSDASKLTTEQLKLKQELKDRVETLHALLQDYDDPGPLYDILHWHDGKEWKAVLADIAEDITQKQPMSDYAVQGEFAQFSKQDLLTYNFKFYEEGDVVSVVVCSGSHGTHVAAITSAYHPPTDAASETTEDPISGVAPGAQLVSLKIGDTRLGSMETAPAFLRALIEIVRLKIDIVNISYGEDAGLPNKGQVIEWMRRVIHEHDVVIISSAGNAGPALSTVGAPGGTTNGVISVGAYVSSNMMAAEYNMLETVPETMYTWCSRGPTTDGDRGVTVYAPGAAVTSVPQYCLQHSQLMNGTSMSSPSACGGISLVLSALKQQKIQYTPHRIRKAIDFTALDVADPLNVGFLQVAKLHDYLVKYQALQDQDVDFLVRVKGVDQARGIYLREAEETHRLYTTSVEVKPEFKDVETYEKWAFEMQLHLVSTVPYIRVPDFVLLGAEGRSFDVQVDPTALPVGLHYTEIVAYDSTTPGRKVFTIPVTITKPAVLTEPFVRFRQLSFSPGAIERLFLAVPKGATYAEMRVKSCGHDAPIRLVAHLTQLLPHVRHTKSERYYVFGLTAEETVSKTFAVTGDSTMEVCLSQFWSSLGTMHVDVELTFHGLALANALGNQPASLKLVGGEGIQRLDLHSYLRLESVSPKIKLDKIRKFLRPTESLLRPLASRDVLPDTTQLAELILTYTLKLTEAADVSYALPLSGYLYDAAIGVLAMVYDVNKRLVHFGDVYPKQTKLEKGEYTFRIQLRHVDHAVLEKVKHLPLTIDLDLEKGKDVSLEFYQDHVEKFDKSKTASFKSLKLKAGDRKSVVVDVNIEGKSYPANAAAGDLLLGKCTLQDEKVEDGDIPVQLVLPPKEKKEDVSGKKGGDAEKEEPKLVDLQVEMAKKIANKEEKQKFLTDLAGQHASHLATQLARLEALPDTTPLATVTSVCQHILGLIDQKELYQFLGRKALPSEQQTKEMKQQAKTMTQQKEALIKVYQRQALAHVAAAETAAKSSGEQTASTSTATATSTAAVDEALQQLRALDDSTTDAKFALPFAQYEIQAGRPASALKTVQKALKEMGNGASSQDAETIKKLLDARQKALQSAGWSTWQTYDAAWHLIRVPPTGFASF